jgi:hypothetical protein
MSLASFELPKNKEPWIIGGAVAAAVIFSGVLRKSPAPASANSSGKMLTRDDLLAAIRASRSDAGGSDSGLDRGGRGVRDYGPPPQEPVDRLPKLGVNPDFIGLGLGKSPNIDLISRLGEGSPQEPYDPSGRGRGVKDYGPPPQEPWDPSLRRGVRDYPIDTSGREIRYPRDYPIDTSGREIRYPRDYGTVDAAVQQRLSSETARERIDLARMRDLVTSGEAYGLLRDEMARNAAANRTPRAAESFARAELDVGDRDR